MSPFERFSRLWVLRGETKIRIATEMKRYEKCLRNARKADRIQISTASYLHMEKQIG